jgi:hypothetical protein
MVHVDKLNRTVPGQGNHSPTINIECESVKGIDRLIVAPHRSCIQNHYIHLSFKKLNIYFFYH